RRLPSRRGGPGARGVGGGHGRDAAGIRPEQPALGDGDPARGDPTRPRAADRRAARRGGRGPGARERGSRGAEGRRARGLGGVGLEVVSADCTADGGEELERLAAGAAFAGVEFYSAYLDPSRPSLFDHLPDDTVILDFEPERQLVDARSLISETEMLAAAATGGAELPRGFELPIVPADRMAAVDAHPRLALTAGEADSAIDL